MEDSAPDSAVPQINGLRYLRMLGRLHAILEPTWYLEIGTFGGRSLSKANCNFVAVDPEFRFRRPLQFSDAKQMFLFQETSDAFFDGGFSERNAIEYDLAFLDGLHHFEVLLRDFINVERLMAPGGVITMHDCCPATVQMASRERVDAAWAGDVWKTLLILLRNRPDLDISVAKAAPTGLVVIRNLDAENTILSDNYDALVAAYADIEIGDLDGGLAGYYRAFKLQTPKAVLEKIAG
jgi:hypothetical protein